MGGVVCRANGKLIFSPSFLGVVGLIGTASGSLGMILKMGRPAPGDFVLPGCGVGVLVTIG